MSRLIRIYTTCQSVNNFEYKNPIDNNGHNQTQGWKGPLHKVRVERVMALCTYYGSFQKEYTEVGDTHNADSCCCSFCSIYQSCLVDGRPKCL